MRDPAKDEKALVADYPRGYYGAAAPHLRACLDPRQAAVNRADVYLGCFRTSCADWFKLPDVRGSARPVDAAEAAGVP